MTHRSIDRVIQSTQVVEGGGFIVQRPFPTRELDHFDPFLLLDEGGPIVHLPGEPSKMPDHPHRGFETFTYFIEGDFEGWDSSGFRERFNSGDVEWTTAGGGIIHGGGPSAEVQKNGGRTHIFQLWVNLAAAKKFIPPQSKRVAADTIPVIRTEDSIIKLIAGEAFGQAGPIQTTTPIQYLHIHLATNGELEVPIPQGHNAMVYVFDGALGMPDAGAFTKGQLALLAGDGESFMAVAAKGGAEFLVISGTPLNEPVARKGPFVMNTKEEVYQAYLDYGAGKFNSDQIPGS